MVTSTTSTISAITPDIQVPLAPVAPVKMGARVREMMDMSLIRMLSAGPDVSLKGSPTVSPTMQALPWSVFLIPSFSQYFFELSHAPPALDIMIAIMQPDAIAPA